MAGHAEKLGMKPQREPVRSIEAEQGIKVIRTKKNEYRARAVIIACGATHRHLGIPGEEELSGMGVSYCATCDAAFFQDRTVVVGGGGNVAVEDAILLSRTCKKVYLVHRRDELRAEKILQECLFACKNVELIWDSIPLSIEGTDKVEALKIQNKKTQEESFIETDGVFIAVGIVPGTEKFKDLDTIVATAKEVNDASGGKCKLFSGYDEIKRSLTGSRTQGFYDENDKITIDDNIKTYMETAKTLYDEDLTFNTDQWSADWSANMSGDGVDSNAALAYMGCPWFVYWSLSDAWKGNTILVPTQTKCYWGGTGLAATTDCADTELAAKIMKFFTCDEDGMVAINALNSDYVNNTAAVSKIIEAGTSADGNGYLYPDAGQNFMEFFLPLADGLDASMVTAEDQQILSLMDTQTKAYATGEKDLDTALADLTASIHDTFSYLSAE